MKNPFKKDVALSYKGSAPTTPYQRAQQEWDMRIGSARVQARNWRILAVISLIIVALLASSLILIVNKHEDRIYVAEVMKDGRVVNVAPLVVRYEPSEAQKEYFVTNFIKLTRSIPLDPVLAKKDWVTAYAFLTNRGSEILNSYFRENDPLSLLGKKTVAVEIVDIHPVSPTSLHVNWMETSVNSNGLKEAEKEYSGVFTIVVKQPTKQKEILNNPLGIFITDFNITQK